MLLSFFFFKFKLAEKETIMKKLESKERFTSSSTAIQRSHLEHQPSLNEKEISTFLTFKLHWFVQLLLFSAQCQEMASSMI